jgi:4-hydroxy-tetrahydrodipicolinate synthase
MTTGAGDRREPVFSGVAVALVTLFDESGALAAEATAAHAARLVELGVQAVVLAGSTGEPAALEPEERLELLDAVRRAVPASVPVVAGTGQPSARQAARLTEMACDHGADAVLALSPPRVADPRQYYEIVSKAAQDTPVLAYHFPASSAPGISVEQLLDLPVVGCKDSSGDPARLLEELARFDGDIYTGDPTLLLQAGMVGAAGAILALANVEPERCISAFAGDPDAQRELIGGHLIARAQFPHGIKSLTARRFGTSTVSRIG